jgi:hypothetical protein
MAAGDIRSVRCQVLATNPDSVTVLLNGDIQINVKDFNPAGLTIGRQAYVTEYYPLDMEGNRPRPFVSASKPSKPEVLFINVDCLDGGENVMTRYRIDTYTGQYKVM